MSTTSGLGARLLALQVATRLGYSDGLNSVEEVDTNNPENRPNMIAKSSTYRRLYMTV
jgi:hypothetical protein